MFYDINYYNYDNKFSRNHVLDTRITCNKLYFTGSFV